MDFAKDANKTIAQELNEKSNVAYFKALCESVSKKYETLFASNMQTYITRIGIMVSNVSVNYEIRYNTYLGAIDFLCNDVLKNKTLYNMLRAIGINDEGNNGKHSIKNINADIDECVRQYNRLIKGLVDIGLSAFSRCYLKLNMVSYRDKKVFEDKYDEKLEALSGTKFKVKLSKDIKLDPYFKTINTQLIVSWPEANKNRTFNIEVYNKGRLLVNESDIILSQGEQYKSFMIKVKESELDRRKLELNVIISLFENIKSTYETGALFWKKTHSYMKHLEKGTKKITVSIII